MKNKSLTQRNTIAPTMKTTKSLILIFTVLAASSASHGAVNTIGGPIINPANGHSYYVLSPGTWNEAEAFAVTLGGHLATINDAAENSWVYANLASSAVGQNPWIGWNDADMNGTWDWVSGEPVTYINWAPDEPNNLSFEFWGHYYGPVHPEQWNNLNSIPENGIVEMVPEPSTLCLMLMAAGSCILRRSRRAKPSP
jgi:hypothetical protein